MKPLRDFVVYIPQKFKDEISFNGGKLRLVNKFQEFEHRINHAKIHAVPIGISENHIGDTLYFHHHVVMEQRYNLGENLYVVNYDKDGGYGNHAIAIHTESGIKMLGDWCFVLPPDEQESESVSKSGIILSIDKKPDLEGKIVALPEGSEWLSAKAGDLVGYTKNSDYAMELTDETKVYRMRITELVYVKEE